MPVILRVEPCGKDWVVKHNEGFLGRVATRDEGARLAGHLEAWLASVGRDVELRIEPEAPPSAPARRAA
jgi:hypothetical protein